MITMQESEFKTSADENISLTFDTPTRREKIVTMILMSLVVLFPPILFLSFKVVEQYKRAVILRLGRVTPNSPVGPGLIWVYPLTDTMLTIDIRTQSINLEPQEVLTKDSVTVTMEAVIYYHVARPISCLMNIQRHSYSTQMLAVAVLRNVLGQYTLASLLSSRDNMNIELRKGIDKVTSTFGVEVERVEIKDVVLPIELQRAMAAEAEGRRIAKAKIIAAEGEIKASESLRNAAQLIADNPKIMLLRYLQTLNYIAAEQATSVLFPFPLEMPKL